MAVPAEIDCTTYWASFIDRDGVVSLTVLFFALDDHEAKRKAKGMVDTQGVDLWDGVRLIEHYPARLSSHPACPALGGY
ncbi:hypothetical protein [Methylobacterium sp. CM6247]